MYLNIFSPLHVKNKPCDADLEYVFILGPYILQLRTGAMYSTGIFSRKLPGILGRVFSVKQVLVHCTTCTQQNWNTVIHNTASIQQIYK